MQHHAPFLFESHIVSNKNPKISKHVNLKHTCLQKGPLLTAKFGPAYAQDHICRLQRLTTYHILAALTVSKSCVCLCLCVHWWLESLKGCTGSFLNEVRNIKVRINTAPAKHEYSGFWWIWCISEGRRLTCDCHISSPATVTHLWVSWLTGDCQIGSLVSCTCPVSLDWAWGGAKAFTGTSHKLVAGVGQ